MMKKLFLLLLLVFTSSLFAQQGFNYKAVIYDNNNPVQNQSIDVKFTVFENISSEIYQETQTTTTDSNGIIILSLGEGTVNNGDFSTINWNMDTFLKVEIDKGAGFQDMGTSQFNYVPLAKYADKAGNAFSGDFNDLDNVPSDLSDGDDDTQLTETQVDSFVANNGYLTSEVDGDTTNELQSLSVSGNQLSITNGNTVTLPTGSGGDQWGSQVVETSTSINGDGTSSNPLSVNTNSADFNGWDKNASDDFDGEFSSLNNIPSGLSDGDDNTQLTETQVDSFVANNGYLTSEVDGSITNELQTISKVGNTVTLSNGGGSFTDADTNTQLTETQVDNFVANNGYLTTEVDGSTTNELQTISKVGNTVTLSNGGGSFTDSDTNTQLTETQVDSFVANNGYLTTEVDGSITNELQTISKVGNTVTLSNGGGSFTDADTNTQLTETQVDNFVANNGYLTTEVDGSITNELQTISKVGNTVTLSNGGGSFTDIDTNTQLTETQVDSFVANNGYLTSEVDGDTTNELQTLAISGNTLSISDGNSITLPSSGGGTDVDFLEVGTGSAPNNILDNIYHEGNISVGHGSVPDAKIDIYNTDNATAVNANTGVYILNDNTSTTDKIGMKLEMEAPPTNNTAVIYGVKNNILDNGDSDIYGEHTTIGGLNGDGNHIGNYITLNSDGSGTHTGTKVKILTGAQGALIGNDIEINTLQATNANTLYAVKTKITGLATGTKYAVSNTLDGDAAGYLFGVKNDISNTANGKHYGVYNKLSGTGTNSHYGSYTKISGSGSGTQIGYTTNNYNSGNGSHYGAHNFIYGSGSGEHIGVKNELSGAGTGNQIGVRNMINNTNGTKQYGVYTTLDATSGNGDRFATRNDLFGAGDGNLYGVRNQVANSGAGAHTGTYNNIYGSGNGTHYGTRNALSGSGTGVQYGNHTVVNNPNNNTHYGSYIEMSGTGDGDKYGVYAKTNHSTSGTEYAIYGEVDSATSYAGYFKGKVTIEGKVTSTSLETDDIVLNNKITTTIGGTDHNMIAHIFGYISEYGDRINQACSNGFTSARIATGRYRITTPISMIYSNAYIVTATIDGNEGIIWVSDRTSTSFVINIKNGFTTTDWLNSDFNFVVYKK